jgi:hypothetical protein
MSPRSCVIAGFFFGAFCIDCRQPPNHVPHVQPQVVSVASSPRADAATPAPPTKAPARSRIVVVRAGDTGRRLWSVAADGKASPIELRGVELKYTLGRLGAGTDAPLPSPDGKSVAYVDGDPRQGKIMIRSLVDESAVAVPRKPRHELYITAWSGSGQKLLYASAPLDGPKGVIAMPDASDLFFFVYDLAKHTSEKIAVPCEFAAWLPAEEVLVVCDSTLVRVRNNTKTSLPKHHESYHQASVGENGTIACVVNDEGTKLEQVIAIEPGTFTERVVSDRGKFADFQFPKPSPSGTHVAYTYRAPLGGGRYRQDLVIDRKTFTEDMDDYEWIDDDTIAVLKASQPPSVVKLR